MISSRHDRAYWFEHPITQDSLLARIDEVPREEVKRDGMICLEWMMQNEIEETACVGPFHAFNHLPKKGDIVTVHNGATVYATGKTKQSVSTRSQKITVFDLNSAFVHNRDDALSTPQVVNIQVRWVGSGGYWKRTNIENVDF